MKGVVLVVLAAGCGRIGFDAVARAGDAPGDTSTDTPAIDATACSTATFDALAPYLSLFGTGMTVFDGTMRNTISGSQGEAAGVQTGMHSFQDRSTAMRVEVAGMYPDALTGPGWHHATGSLHLFITQGTVRFEDNIGVVSTVPYDPVMHRWLRLRSAGTEVVAETSPDGSVWTSHGLTAVGDLSSTYLDLGLDASANLPGQDVSVIDDLVICPPL